MNYDFSLASPPRGPLFSISPLSLDSVLLQCGLSPNTPASAVWISANRALFVPFTVRTQVNVTALGIANGTVTNGNFDLGVYRAGPGGPTSLVVSTGSTAQSGSDVLQDVAVAATLYPGDYYLASVFDNITATAYRVAPNISLCSEAGVVQQASAFPLPATASPASLANGLFYMSRALVYQ